MKYLITALLTFTAIIAATHWGGAYLIPPTPEVAWIEELYDQKSTILETLDPPRVVLVGGSEVLHGVSAELMSEMLGMPTVNFGTHAALGWPTHIERVEPLLKEGDVILFSLNRNLIKRHSVNAVLSSYVQQAEPSLVFNRPISQWVRLLGRDLVHELIRRPMLEIPRTGARRRAAEISEYGDEIRHEAATGEMQARLRSEVRHTENFACPLEELTPSLGYVKHFAQRMVEKGVRVLTFWPAALEVKGMKSAKSMHCYRQWNLILEKEGLAVINGAGDLLLPVEMMFDSPNHPNDRGRAEVTRILAREVVNASILDFPDQGNPD